MIPGREAIRGSTKAGNRPKETACNYYCKLSFLQSMNVTF